MSESLSLFVPGRLCLFGEHSDWAGAARREHPELSSGMVIIAGTNQGVFAETSRAADGLLHLSSTLPDGTVHTTELPMDVAALSRTAAEATFFSYAAGVAAVLLKQYPQLSQGLFFRNTRTDLPVKKGVSSSAAICVAIARAFSLAYKLNLSVEDEMEAAYQGEILTPSRCGRMDQGCAFGQTATIMTFDGDTVAHHPVTIGNHFQLLIADLKARKDTVRILADLTSAYQAAIAAPPSSGTAATGIYGYFNGTSNRLCNQAADILANGTPQALGELMSAAQAAFDEALIPVCPTELTAPKLHTVLNDSTVQSLTYGGKGIGSQGDGTVQFVCKSAAARESLRDYLSSHYHMDSFPLDLKPAVSSDVTSSSEATSRTPRIHKALIPAAGLGTRMFPATKAVKKELLPIITPDGICKPILQAIVEEAFDAGCDDIAIIVRPDDKAAIEQLFAPLSPEHLARLPETARKQCSRLEFLGQHITYIMQTEQQGFGHAVYCAHDWAAGEPVLLLLGDHLYTTNTSRSCAQQLLDAAIAHPHTAVLSFCTTPASTVHYYGIATGDWLDDTHTLLNITEFAEKPSLDYAQAHLTLDGIPADTFLCVFGQYLLTPEVFIILGQQIAANQRQKGEFQLTSALEELRRSRGLLGLIVDGTHYDTGQPREYLESLIAYAEFHARQQ